MNKHKNTLKEIAKFAAGLITADFLVGLFVLNSSIGPFSFWGINFTQQTVEAWMIFDVILLAILFHYAWHADVHTPSLKQRGLFLIIGIMMGFIGLAHFLRVVFGVDINIGGWMVPQWLSWIGTVVALFLSYTSFRFAK